MILLKPEQIASWYKFSLEYSGYKELYGFARDLWKDLVRRGNRAVPPGFLARFIELYLSVSVGVKNENHSTDPLEDQYLDLIRKAPGADRLEGIFIISGADRDPVLAQPVLVQLIDRLPAFRHKALVFSESDFEKSFEVENPANAGFNMQEVLQLIYKSSIEEFSQKSFSFDADDIFEIGHPQLFSRAADRLFYRRMVNAMHGLGTWTRSIFTLKEESSWVVTKYGEPQVLPLGGYDELTNKGTISSIVPSELAYMDESMEFDLFDYKFIENQLMYFKRDSGAVFRIRRDIRIKLRLSEFFEHEKHLGLLFAWIFNFAGKLIETLVKDMVNVFIELEGYVPSSLKDACRFFGHFLDEKKLSDRICLRAGDFTTSETMELRPEAQTWLFAEKPENNSIFIELQFPQSDEFAAYENTEQYRILGGLINDSIERMVKHDQGGWS
ncbi:MAG: hypothetical protein ACQETH_10700 [Candidatus Rifleibacteriota bacterium]